MQTASDDDHRLLHPQLLIEIEAGAEAVTEAETETEIEEGKRIVV
jgi:hypothetical protein